MITGEQYVELQNNYASLCEKRDVLIIELEKKEKSLKDVVSIKKEIEELLVKKDIATQAKRDFNDLNDTVSSLKTEISNLEDTKEVLTQNITEIKNKSFDISEEINFLNKQKESLTKDLKLTLSKTEKEILEKENFILSQDKAITSKNEIITAFNSSFTELESKKIELEKEVNDFIVQIDTLKNEATSALMQKQEILEEIKEQKDKIALVDAEIENKKQEHEAFVKKSSVTLDEEWGKISIEKDRLGLN